MRSTSALVMAFALSFSSSVFAETSAPTVSLPPIKSSEKAAQDLKRDVPLDLSKLGDPLPANLFIELSKLINPTVVSITTSTLPHGRTVSRDPLQDFLEDFWGGRGGMPPGMHNGSGGQRPQVMQGLGTGFIIREDGLIVTNNHVIEGADTIKVQLDANSDTLYEAAVIGHDTLTDVALIKIDAKKKLPFARLGSSRDVEVGEWVAAFGNPYGHAHTMTKGIVSAIGREIAELNRFPFIQTDASINPGNSGGPLVNTRGLVIGVNTAIDARAQGIGFAIPIDNVKQVIEQLETKGRVSRGYIGVGIDGINDEMASALGMDEPKGVLISAVVRDGPAFKAGIRPYDIVVDFGGKKTNSPAELQNAIGSTTIDSIEKVTVWRYANTGTHKELSFKVKVSENPEETRPKKTQQKQYFGQKAPFDLGFKVTDYTAALAEELGLPENGPKSPIIIDIDRGSPASALGLQAGDQIIDVNRAHVNKATDVVKGLKKGRNILRINRGGTSIIVTIGQ